MSAIHEYIVVEPPTSGELETRAVSSLGASRVLELTIRANRDIPKPRDVAAAFLIKQTIYPDKGGMIVSGSGLHDSPDADSSFIVRTNAIDLTQPATISIVRS